MRGWIAGWLCCLGVPAFAQAGIAGTGGAVRVVAAPASVERGVFEAPVASVFLERGPLFLANAVGVDLVGVGTFDASGDERPGVVPAGAAVESYLVHGDAVGSPGFATMSGSVTFDRRVLGVVLLTGALDATDAVLGSPVTAYPAGQSDRRVDVSVGGDRVSVLPGERTVSFTFEIRLSAIDQFRVVVEAGRCGLADVDEPVGVLDIEDVLRYLGLFVAGLPQADLDGNGVLDIDDVLRFLIDFNAGC